MTKTKRTDPATSFVRQLEGDWYMLREAAELVGVSQFTLRKLIFNEAEGLVPSHYTMFGRNKIYLYTKDDIDRIRAHFEARQQVFVNDGSRRTGRPPVYTSDERRERARLYSRAWYWRSRIKQLETEGKTKELNEAKRRLAEVERKLK